jgi:hypothetical protein
MAAYRFHLFDFAFERMEFHGQGAVLGGEFRPLASTKGRFFCVIPLCPA